jgi:hypothetical protein
VHFFKKVCIVYFPNQSKIAKAKRPKGKRGKGKAQEDFSMYLLFSFDLLVK